MIRNGKIDEKEMHRNRISIDELFSELRQKDAVDISEIDYAIMEQNGKLTVIKKRLYDQPTLNDLKIRPKECGIPHIIISDGRIDKNGLRQVGKSRDWLCDLLKSKKLSPSEIYVMTLDDSENCNIIKRSDLI